MLFHVRNLLLPESQFSPQPFRRPFLFFARDDLLDSGFEKILFTFRESQLHRRLPNL